MCADASNLPTNTNTNAGATFQFKCKCSPNQTHKEADAKII